MIDPPTTDERWMRRAIELAQRADPSPNPRVGAVVVKDGVVIGEGHHQRAGTPHAEVHALAAAGAAAAGATLYVTLEPCNHHGRTPPCVDAVLAAGIARVVMGCRDPNPVATGGLERLRAAGVAVTVGVCASAARALIAAWAATVSPHQEPWMSTSPQETSALQPRGGADRFRRHRGPVTCVAAVPGRPMIVTSAYDSAVGCFDLDRQSATILGYHEHLVNRIVVNATGTKAASCSSDYTVRIWDLATRELERVLRGHADDVEDFLFVSDEIGVSASRDHRVMVWDLTTGAILRIIDEHEKDVLSLAYVDGKIVSSGDDRTLRVFDLATGAPLSSWGPFDLETDTCAIDPRTGRVVLGCDDGCVRIFRLGDGSLVQKIAGHALGIKKVAVSPVNGDILSSAYDQSLHIWDAETFALKRSLERTPVMWERSLNWSDDGRMILAGTFDGTVIGWDAATGAQIFELGDAGAEKGNACFNDVAASGGEMALVADDGYVRLATVEGVAPRLLAKVEPRSGRVLMNGVAFSSREDLVAAGAHNHRLYLFDRRGDELVGERESQLGEGPINTIAIAEISGYGGDAFVGCYSSAIVRVGRDGVVKDTIRVHDGAVKSLSLHPTLPIGVSCGADGVLVSWGFDGELRQRYLGHTAIINDVDLDPTGARIASVSRDFSLKVWDRDGGQLLRSMRLGRRSLKSVCFYDEDTVLVGDYWGTLVKVELTSGRVTRLRLGTNGISALARSDEHVVAVSYDGGVYLVAPGELAVAGSLRSMRQRVHDRTVE